MKKLVLLFIVTLLVLQTTACNTQTVNNNEKETNDVETESAEQLVDEDKAIEDVGLITIKTKHFSVKVPKWWEELCYYEIDEMSVAFIHKMSYDYCKKNYGYEAGYLFSIAIEDLSYYWDTETEILGGLGIPDMGEFNVWKTGPSDVQFTDETYEEYSKVADEIENIISTLTFNEGYYFSKTPYEITNNEEYTPNYEQPQPQQQPQQQNAINETKLCSMAFDHFCRMAIDLRNELRKEGYRSVDASAVYPPKVVSRTEQLVTIEGKINYWIGGGNPAGSFKATVVYDKYSGTVVMDDLN